MNNQGLPPADLSKLKSILGNAKAIMKKTESGNYETGNVTLDNDVNGNQLVENTGQNQQQQQMVTNNPANNPAPKIVNGQPQYRNMETSKMPSFIKEAMMNSPIPQVSMAGSTFSLDDVSELVDKPLPKQMSNPKRSRQVNEVIQNNNDTFTVSESSLRGIIRDVVKDELLEFMSETFSKKLTENAIKKTINTLIKEGKLKTKKPVNS